MKKPEHNNLVISYHEINSVWKSPEQTAPEFVINLWALHWIPRNLTGTGIKYPQEFLTKPW
jgi:hypothetical protein